ncbi:GH92 family glycosyl hydrolase [uncultured Parabacteroides sp.]|uniref:GH92 family glycosyl hydrolase n=1 Tax=uncultured Parabacteroides sp. TaxID=512312 RepID=UPI0025D237E4|nr:GH92 family glycosyl hydrolase [uncultured Parabacteroides sp.]
MKKKISLCSLILCVISFSCSSVKDGPDAQQALSSYVNPFVGASTSMEAGGSYHGLGKTFPGATSPFGMVQLSPNTITGGDNGSGYSDEHTSIEGFAFTQMSGIGWYGDLGNLLVMPTVGKLHTFSGTLEDPDNGYRSRYDKASEKASAGYYSVMLTDYQIKAEATALPHSGMLRFTFPESKEARIQIDLARRGGGTSTWQAIEVINDHTIRGEMKCPPEGGGWGNGAGKSDYTVYFYAEFSRPFRSHGVWSADIPDGWTRKREDIESERYHEVVRNARVLPDVKSLTGRHLGFYAEFDTDAGEQILMKSGISFTSMKNAEENLHSEMNAWEFDATLADCRRLWDDALSKITVTGGTEDEKHIFYTALYHTMIDPRICSDVNGEYMGANKQAHMTDQFTKRTIFSGWDVFRSQMPLQTIINPTLINDLVNSLVEIADQSGNEYLERWELLNAYSGCMLGNPALSVLCDAYSKGIRSYDIDKAYRYALNTSRLFGNNEDGYTPGSISHTLEYAYNDWCMARLAEWLGKDTDKEYFDRRAMTYSTIYDTDYGWFRPRNEKGEFQPLPEEGRLAEGYGCTESNAYQQGWFIPHDVEGMVQMMGGREKVLADLTDMFEQTPEGYLWNQYYNHANEPVHHVPFLFNRLGAPELTQKWTRDICRNAYKNSVLGLVGNEDVGQMSAWYVLAASGIHPVCPGDQRYEITSPVFEKVVFNLDPDYAEGKTFVIEARNNSPENIYVQQATLNGIPYDKCYLTHADLMKGGTLVLQMGAKPSDWGK